MYVYSTLQFKELLQMFSETYHHLFNGHNLELGVFCTESTELRQPNFVNKLGILFCSSSIDGITQIL